MVQVDPVPTDSRRVQAAKWITSPVNPYFAKSYVNRVWGYLLGVGIIIIHRGTDIGIVVGAGLAGGAAATLFATVRGNRLGRRRLLIALALLGVAGAVVAAIATDPWVLAAAAFGGMLNGMGRDRARAPPPGAGT